MPTAGRRCACATPRADASGCASIASSRGGHWHLDPAGRDQITQFDEGFDSLGWTVAELRRDLDGLLARAGLAARALPARELAHAIDAVERALRNPPAELDAVRPSSRRPSRGEKWTTYPDDVLPLWVADMDFPIAEPIRRVLRFAVERSDLGYPIHPAPTEIPELTAERMQRVHGWSVAPERVEIISDVVQGMYTAVHQFSEPGEGVVVQTPIYPPFLGSVLKQGRRLDENALALGPRGYTFDLEQLRGTTDAATRILLLCNPHNPTGRAFRRDELAGARRARGRTRLDRGGGRDPSGPRVGRSPARSVRVARARGRGAHDHAHRGVEGVQHRGAALRGGDLRLRRAEAPLLRAAAPSARRDRHARDRGARRGVAPQRAVARRGVRVPRGEPRAS